MRKVWEIKKLADVCEFQNGFAFKSNTYKEKGLPIIRITNIQNDVIDPTELVYFDPKDYKENFERYKVNKGDLLIAMSGATTGKLGINTSDTIYYLNQRVGKFIPKSTLNKTYLYYFLSTKVEESLRISAGAAQPNLSTDQIKSFEIPFPPLSEQKRIVEILDEAFAAIDNVKANVERNLQNAKELFESCVQNLLEGEKFWDTKNLIELCEIFVDSAHRTPKYQTDGIPALRPRDVVNGNLNLDSAARVSTDEYEIQTRRYKPQSGDIVYSRELSYGWAAVLPNSPIVCLSQGMCLFRPSSILHSSFLLYVLNGPIGRSQAQRVAVGAAHPHVNISDIKAYRIPAPPLNEQKNVVRQLDKIANETKKLESIYQQKLNDLEELKKSILQKAFTGELTAKALSIIDED